jgi:hypothetical protein
LKRINHLELLTRPLPPPLKMSQVAFPRNEQVKLGDVYRRYRARVRRWL